jgi:hypothetical protein
LTDSPTAPQVCCAAWAQSAEKLLYSHNFGTLLSNFGTPLQNPLTDLGK